LVGYSDSNIGHSVWTAEGNINISFFANILTDYPNLKTLCMIAIGLANHMDAFA
jgi:hypothetical protein